MNEVHIGLILGGSIAIVAQAVILWIVLKRLK